MPAWAHAAASIGPFESGICEPISLPPVTMTTRAGRVTVAEYEGELVGMTSVGPLDGHLALWKLYVLPRFQSSGVGGMLMRAAIAKARADGYDQIVLSYLAGNDNARGFYEHYGFTETGRESTGGGVPDSVWLRLLLEDETHA